MEEFNFSADYQEDKFLLFEFPSEELLQSVIKGNAKIEFVSNKIDPIVLCTENRTYDILEFDTSNLLLVHDGPTILSGNTSTFELRDKGPPFLSFRQLVHTHPITEAEIRGESLESPNFLDEVRNNILCSHSELDQFLAKLCAITIDGAIKTPTPDMKNLIINQVLQYSRTISDWKRVDIENCLNMIRIPLIEYQPMKDIFMSVLRFISEDINENEAVLDEKKVTRHLADYVFRNSRNGHISVKDFNSEMEDLLPTSTKLNMDYLFGMFVTTKRGYQFIDEEKLPIELIARFNAVFEICSEWEVHEIEPLFEYFVTESLNFIDLAGRHCRFADGKWMHR